MSLAARVAARSVAFTFQRMTGPPAEGDARSFNASLGTIPDYAGPPGGAPGVLLAGVRGGAPAERGGLRRGDILVRLGVAPDRRRRGPDVRAEREQAGRDRHRRVKRDGKELKLPVTFEEGRRGK